MNLYVYEETSSTNDLARKPIFRQGDIIWAYSQTNGRGQRGNTWTGESASRQTILEPWTSYALGQNAAFTIVLEPLFLKASEQFLISQITALALSDALCSLGIDGRIKWTNDIYVLDKKIAGVLIENNLSNGFLARSMIGIGLNINQIDFDPSLPNPTSIRIESGRITQRESLIRLVYANLLSWYEKAQNGEFHLIREEYSQRLYRKGEWHTYRNPSSGALFQACLEGVGDKGELQLRVEDSHLREFLFREIEFVIKSP